MCSYGSLCHKLTHGSQRRTCRSQYLSTMWVSGSKSQPLGLLASAFYPLSKPSCWLSFVVFWDRLLLCSSGQPQTCAHPISAPPLVQSWAYKGALTPRSHSSFSVHFAMFWCMQGPWYTSHGDWVTRKSYQEACLHTPCPCLYQLIFSWSGTSPHHCEEIILWIDFSAVNDRQLLYPTEGKTQGLKVRWQLLLAHCLTFWVYNHNLFQRKI